MKAEFILAVKTAALDVQNLHGNDQPLYLLQVPELLPYLQKDLILGQREALEADETHRQLLPYIVLRKMFGDVTKYFAYRRRNGVREARLGGNVSIGVGGHIDMVDIQHADSVIDPMATIAGSVQRELEEEIEFSTEGMAEGEEGEVLFHSVGALVDNSNAVGKVHLGLVFTATVDENTDVKCAEEELETLGWFTATELLAAGLPLENWTNILLEHFAESEFAEGEA